MATPIKSKKAVDVVIALKQALQLMNLPHNLQMDKGREFNNNTVVNVLNNYKLHHFYSNEELNAEIVEESNRTLGDKQKKKKNIYLFKKIMVSNSAFR